MAKGTLNKEIKAKCTQCKKSYRKAKEYQRFCSVTCRMAWHSENVICVHCGKNAKG